MVSRQHTTYKCNKETEIALIKQKVENQDQMISEIHKAIVGNGKPGLLADMQQIKINSENMGKLVTEHESALKGIGTKMAFYAGAITVVVFIINLLVNKYF